MTLALLALGAPVALARYWWSQPLLRVSICIVGLHVALTLILVAMALGGLCTW